VNSHLEFLPYPEEIRETPLGQRSLQIIRPQRAQVVMGAGGRPEREVFAEALLAEGIPLYRRKGGGGTVLLGPETLVVTIHAGVAHPFHNLAYFRALNDALIDLFRQWKPLDFRQRGISDIAVDDRKLVGSSIFRRRQYLLYQASILVDLDLARMRRLLREPPRQPDYRLNREHGSFLTCLRRLGIDTPVAALMTDLEVGLPERIDAALSKVDGPPENERPKPSGRVNFIS